MKEGSKGDEFMYPKDSSRRFDAYSTPFSDTHDQKGSARGYSDYGYQQYPKHFNPNASTRDYSGYGGGTYGGKSGFNRNTSLVMVHQPLKEIEIEGSLEIGLSIQKELYRIALQGELVLLQERLFELVDETITKKFNRKTSTVLDKANEAGIVHSTLRTFADGHTVIYVGLQLEVITVESLGWICRSIKNDAMAPTEKLILSRIKECFALKLTPEAWKIILDHLLEYPGFNKKSEESKGIPSFEISNITDPSTGADTYVIGIRGEEWDFDDLGTVDEGSLSWKAFLKFLDDFFRADEDEETEDEGNKIAQQRRESRVSLNEFKYKNERNINQMAEGRAIPGGRYGCAQFIKACGPETLRNESLGKLNLYVQEAINKGILRYQRTLLVKNTQAGILEGKLDSASATGENSAVVMKQLQQLGKIKEALVEILAENPGGLSLAQIPQYLRRRLSFSFNLQDMGFPKLKNLLNTMTDDIKIELSGTNHSYASLKNPQKYAHLARRRGNRNYYGNVDDPSILFGYSVNTGMQHHTGYQEAEPVHHQHHAPTQSKYYVKKYEPYTPETHFEKSNKTVYNKKLNSSSEEYFEKAKGIIENNIKKYPSGVDIDQFYAQLSKELGNNFDFGLFGCRSFNEFLTNHAEESVELQIKKVLGTQKATYYLFPKHSRFTPSYPVKDFGAEQYFFQPLPQQQQQLQQQQTTPGKLSKPPLHSGISAYLPSGGTFNNQGSPDYRVAANPLLYNPQRPLYQVSTNISSNQSTESKERQYFSPVIQVDESPTHTRNDRYLRSNFAMLDTEADTPQSNLRRMQEDSSMEPSDTFKFIDDLLKENSNPKKKSSFHEGNINIGSTWDKGSSVYDKSTHIKNPSGDFGIGGQNLIRYPPGLKIGAHGNIDFEDNQRSKFIGSQNSM